MATVLGKRGRGQVGKRRDHCGGDCNNPGETGSDQGPSCRSGEKLLHSEAILRVKPVALG